MTTTLSKVMIWASVIVLALGLTIGSGIFFLICVITGVFSDILSIVIQIVVVVSTGIVLHYFLSDGLVFQGRSKKEQ